MADMADHEARKLGALATQRIEDHMKECAETRVETRNTLTEMKKDMTERFTSGDKGRERLHARVDETNKAMSLGFKALTEQRSKDRLATYGQIVALLLTIVGFFVAPYFQGH